MKMTTVFATGIALGVSMLTHAPTAQATAPTISPGDRIDYVTDDGSSAFCTTGYVYTGTNGHAYAITAGHCQIDEPGHVVEETSGATGRFVNAVVGPPRSGGPDYGLIDFGPHVASRPDSATISFATDTRPPAVQVGQEV